MSPDARRMIERELEMLRRLIDEHRTLIEMPSNYAPTLIEREALATLLHSFYSGVESIMRTIAVMAGEFSKGDSWHAQLLHSMQHKTPVRCALLNSELADSLAEYLAFRHRFRNLYGFELEWARMQPLINRVESTLREFETAVRAFLIAQ